LRKLFHFLFTELKLSFCHTLILHQESSFSLIHKLDFAHKRKR